MSDLISRQAAIDCVNRAVTKEVARWAIQELPSAEPERKTGRWMFYERCEPVFDIGGVTTWGKAYRCSECGFIYTVIEDFGMYDFCPNCGADTVITEKGEAVRCRLKGEPQHITGSGRISHFATCPAADCFRRG